MEKNEEEIVAIDIEFTEQNTDPENNEVFDWFKMIECTTRRWGSYHFG